jgi:glycosyltransferase involved in cell wall biosynthesis
LARRRAKTINLILKKVLFISLDGMTDPLGQSQVLPYLQGLSQEGFEFTLLSFEKTERYEKGRHIIEDICKNANIDWVPLPFQTSPPIVSKWYNRHQMYKTAEKLHHEKHFDLTHCRSYLAAEVGMKLKQQYKVPYLFDMRGFWADEKKESNLWPQEKWIYKKIYQYYKKQEKALVRNANHIISLTYAGKREMETWSFYDPSVPITVIPCCADMNHFSLTTTSDKVEGRKILNIPQDTFVVSYLGAVGTWYMLDDMLYLFKSIKERYTNALFLFVTHSSPKTILDKAKALNISEKDILIKEASRKEVPLFMKSCDLSISFIQPIYSKLSSSPTKLGEIMAMGIPVITNSGVGDVAEIVKDRGIVVNSIQEKTLSDLPNSIPHLLEIAPVDIRSRSMEWYDLKKGVETYKKAYRAILGNG